MQKLRGRQQLNLRGFHAQSVTEARHGNQCFGYDWLNRLTGAFTGDASCASYSATGIGAYNHAYAYNAIGNITSNAGNNYTYHPTKPHAVTAAFGNSVRLRCERQPDHHASIGGV